MDKANADTTNTDTADADAGKADTASADAIHVMPARQRPAFVHLLFCLVINNPEFECLIASN